MQIKKGEGRTIIFLTGLGGGGEAGLENCEIDCLLRLYALK